MKTGFASNITATIALAGLALCSPMAATAQTAPDAADAASDDPRPVSLQSPGALLFMLSQGEISGDFFRPELDAYNALYPVPSGDALSTLLLTNEAASATRRNVCVPTGMTEVNAAPETAAPAVRQYIANGEIVNGWTVSAAPQGCSGNTERVVYTVMQRPDGTFTATRLGVGETLINLNIHYDLGKVLSENLGKFYALAGASCENSYISAPNMRVVSQEGVGEPFYGSYLAGKWREEWTFTGCGGTAVIPIDMEWQGKTDTEYFVQFPEATFTPDA